MKFWLCQKNNPYIPEKPSTHEREISHVLTVFFFTLKALLLCAVPLFRSSSSDLAADYNVSLCGQRCSAQRFLLSSMIFFFIIRHQNPNEKHHRYSAQNSRIKFYTQKSAKIGFLRSFCRSSPNFATDLLQTCYKRLKRGPPTRFIINMQK